MGPATFEIFLSPEFKNRIQQFSSTKGNQDLINRLVQQNEAHRKSQSEDAIQVRRMNEQKKHRFMDPVNQAGGGDQSGQG